MGGRPKRKNRGPRGAPRDDPPSSSRRTPRAAVLAAVAPPARALRRARFDIEGLDIVLSSSSSPSSSLSSSSLGFLAGSDSDSDDEEAAIQDFLDNVARGGVARDTPDDDDDEDDEDEDEEAGLGIGRVPNSRDVARWLTANPLSSPSPSWSSEFDSGSGSDSGSDSGGSTSTSTSSAGGPRRFPVSDGSRHAVRVGAGVSGKRAKGKRGRGAGPRYDPGEKRRLKRASLVERRGARSGIEGTLGLLRGQLEAVVAGGGDMWCSPPLKGTLDRKLASALCRCFGMEGTVARTGKRAVLTARATARTAIPEPGSEAAERLDILVGVGLVPQRELKRHRGGAKAGGKKQGHADARRARDEQLREMGVQPSSSKGKGKGKGRARGAAADPGAEDARDLPVRMARLMGGAFVAGGRIVDAAQVQLDNAVADASAGGPSRRRAGKATGAPASSVGGEFGAFAAHTTGFGAKYLSKLGYAEGRGLGARGDGIAEPVEARPRGGRLGLGFGPGEGKG